MYVRYQWWWCKLGIRVISSAWKSSLALNARTWRARRRARGYLLVHEIRIRRYTSSLSSELKLITFAYDRFSIRYFTGQTFEETVFSVLAELLYWFTHKFGRLTEIFILVNWKTNTGEQTSTIALGIQVIAMKILSLSDKSLASATKNAASNRSINAQIMQPRIRLNSFGDIFEICKVKKTAD